MDSSSDEWQNELNEDVRPIEKLTVAELTSIKGDRIQNNLPFDVSVNDNLLHTTNAR